jgi:RND family efflux transporter MFP subunit
VQDREATSPPTLARKPRRLGLAAWVAWLVALAAIVAAIAGWWWAGPVTVETALPTRGPAIQAVYATGTVEPTVVIPVSVRSGGRLVSLHANEGERVRRGQVLARTESEDLEHTVDEMRSRERLAQSQHARNRELAAVQFVSPAEVERTERELEAARSASARARALRDYTSIKAPFDGVVLRRDGEPGQFVAAGQAVYSLACCAPLRVTADVDEEDIALVRPGQKVAMRTDDIPGRIFDGTVAEITPQGNPSSRSYRVRVRFDETQAVSGGLLRPGMTMDANMVVGIRDQVLLVPTLALHGQDVWVVAQGRAHRRSLSTGLAGNGRTEVTSGLQDGERVILDAPQQLREGRRIRPSPASSPGK